MKIDYYVVFFFLIMLFSISNTTLAQENKHSFYGLVFVAPDETSFNTIYRIDSGWEPLVEDTKTGFEIGYTYKLFPIMSIQLALQNYSLSGYEDTDIERSPIRIFGNRLLIGAKFHTRKENSKFEFDLGIINGWTIREHNYSNVLEKDKAPEKGIFIGVSRTFDFGEYLYFKLGIRAMGYNSSEARDSNSGSGYINQNLGASLDLNLSYVIKF